MFKRMLLAVLIFTLISNGLVLAGEGDFHLSNWPLADFESRRIINSYSEKIHNGVDIAANEGEEVKAVADGKVYWTYSGGANGISVGIEHKNGWRTTYLHLSERLVKRGLEVKASDIIGKVGTTGTGRDSEEPHLHFGLIIDSKADITEASKRYANPLLFGPVSSEPPNQEQEQPKEQPLEEMAPETTPETPEAVSVVEASPQKLMADNLLEGNLAQKILPQENSLPKGKKIKQISRQMVKKSEVEVKKQALKQKVAPRSLMEAEKVFVKASRQYQIEDLRKEEGEGRPRPIEPLIEGKPVKLNNKSTVLLYWLLLIIVGTGYMVTRNSKLETRSPSYSC